MKNAGRTIPLDKVIKTIVSKTNCLADYPIPVIYKIAGDSINAANRSTDFLCGQKDN
jgi:hypothetical protein